MFFLASDIHASCRPERNSIQRAFNASNIGTTSEASAVLQQVRHLFSCNLARCSLVAMWLCTLSRSGMLQLPPVPDFGLAIKPGWSPAARVWRRLSKAHLSGCTLSSSPKFPSVTNGSCVCRFCDEYAYIQQYLKKQFDKSQNLEKDLGITAAQAASARPAKRGGPGASRGPATDPTPSMTAVVAEAPVHTTTRSGREVRAPSRK